MTSYCLVSIESSYTLADISHLLQEGEILEQDSIKVIDRNRATSLSLSLLAEGIIAEPLF